MTQTVKTKAPQTDAETALGGPLPSRRDEAWKWTDLRGRVNAKAQGLTLAGKPQFSVPGGVTVTQTDSLIPNNATALSQFAKAFAGESYFVHVPKGWTGEALSLENLSHGHVRIHIHVETGAALNITEHHSGQDNGFANIDLHMAIDADAQVIRTVIQDDPDTMVRVNTATVTLANKAKFKQFTLAFGGDLVRLETRIDAVGRDTIVNMGGAYLLNGQRHLDMTSHMDLRDESAHVRQAVKGVVTDKSRGVFQGKFHVERTAQFADAEMRHDALMLSDNSEIRSKPELEIYADDVACAHGNTIGQLDESALFYMQQRGIPIAQAKALLMEAFLADVFDDLDDEGLKDSIVGKLREWLAA